MGLSNASSNQATSGGLELQQAKRKTMRDLRTSINVTSAQGLNV